ncbi:MAG: hypothetical protein K2X63_03290 [Burkholderiaceae bacterium]|nr:hypothetical protein [Burkholderiaceae bacterium]
MSLLGWFNQRRAKRAYTARLPSLLEAKYGKATHYSPQQIESTIDDAQMSNAYMFYAIAMFASRDDFQQHYAAQPSAPDLDYDRLRSESMSPDSTGSVGKVDANGELVHQVHDIGVHHVTHSDYGSTTFDAGSSGVDSGM